MRALRQAGCYNGVEVSLRDELMSIERVPVRYARIVPEHPLLQRDRFAQKVEIRLQLEVCLALIAIWLLGWVAMLVLAPSGYGPIAAAICLSDLALFIGVPLIAQMKGGFLKARMLKPIVWKDVEDRVGPILFSNEYVGVSFSSDCWIVGQSPVVDLGALSVDFDRIRFAGRKIDFELPGARVENVDIVRADVSQMGPYMPARITWRHPDGSLQYVCIQPRDARNARELYRDVVDLRNRIEDLRKGPHLSESDESLLPPKSSCLPLDQRPMFHLTQRELWTSVANSAVATGVVFGLAELLVFLITGQVDWFVAAYVLPCWMLFWLLGMIRMRRRATRT